MIIQDDDNEAGYYVSVTEFSKNSISVSHTLLRSVYFFSFLRCVDDTYSLIRRRGSFLLQVGSTKGRKSNMNQLWIFKWFQFLQRYCRFRFPWESCSLQEIHRLRYCITHSFFFFIKWFDTTNKWTLHLVIDCKNERKLKCRYKDYSTIIRCK